VSQREFRQQARAKEAEMAESGIAELESGLRKLDRWSEQDDEILRTVHRTRKRRRKLTPRAIARIREREEPRAGSGTGSPFLEKIEDGGES
jgi:glutamine synthetase adenylyltransferase